jgi:hypothetical protein
MRQHTAVVLNLDPWRVAGIARLLGERELIPRAAARGRNLGRRPGRWIEALVCQDNQVTVRGGHGELHLSVPVKDKLSGSYVFGCIDRQYFEPATAAKSIFPVQHQQFAIGNDCRVRH